jgi:hypothetical protein
MNSLTTWLAGTVESMLPSTAAAACVGGRRFCQTEVLVNGGKVETYHRYCTSSCNGKTTGCSGWTPGGC